MRYSLGKVGHTVNHLLSNVDLFMSLKPETKRIGISRGLYLGYRNCFKYSGRATGPEWWYMYAFAWIISIFVEFLLNSGQISSSPETADVIMFFVVLAVYLPVISVSIRRLHDIGKSAWWLLWIMSLLLVPLIILGIGELSKDLIMDYSVASKFYNTALVIFAIATIGWIILFFILFSRAGEADPNKYGPPPTSRVEVTVGRQRIPRRDLGLLDCPNCGATPPTDDSRFCSQCGTGLK